MSQIETAAPAQARLDAALERVDQEMARAADDYDAARKDLAAHHEKMAGEHAAAGDDAAALREKLSSVVFDGKKPYAQFEADLYAYLDAVTRQGNAARARRMTFGATQKPGEYPTGGSLGDDTRQEGVA